MTMSSAYLTYMRSFTVNVLSSSPMTRLHNKGDSTLPCDQPVVVFTKTMLPLTKVPSLSCYQKVVSILMPFCQHPCTPCLLWLHVRCFKSSLHVYEGMCRYYLFFKDFGMRSISSTRVVSVDLPALYACWPGCRGILSKTFVLMLLSIVLQCERTNLSPLTY